MLVNSSLPRVLVTDSSVKNWEGILTDISTLFQHQINSSTPKLHQFQGFWYRLHSGGRYIGCYLLILHATGSPQTSGRYTRHIDTFTSVTPDLSREIVPSSAVTQGSTTVHVREFSTRISMRRQYAFVSSFATDSRFSSTLNSGILLRAGKTRTKTRENVIFYNYYCTIH